MRAPMRSPVSSRCFTRAPTAAIPLYALPQHADAPQPAGSSTPASQATHEPRTTPPEPPTAGAPEGTAHGEAKPPLPKDAGHTEPDPIPPWGTALVSQPRNARSGTHDRDAPSLSTDAAQEGRIPDALPARPQKPLPTATPRSPGTPTEHGSSPGPGSQHGTASGPCGPADRPACGPSCREGSVCATLARATLARRLLQTVARRRLAAIAAVQTETALQITYPLPKPSVLQLKTRDLLSGSLGPGHPQRVKRFGTTHPKVDSFSNPRVNPPPTQTSWAVTTKHDIS